MYIHEGSLQISLLSTKSGKARTGKRFKVPANSMANVSVKISDIFLNDVVLLEPLPLLNKYELTLVKSKFLNRVQNFKLLTLLIWQSQYPNLA